MIYQYIRLRIPKFELNRIYPTNPILIGEACPAVQPTLYGLPNCCHEYITRVPYILYIYAYTIWNCIAAVEGGSNRHLISHMVAPILQFSRNALTS